MNRNAAPRPSAAALRVAVATLTRDGNSPDVAGWLSAQAVQQDFEERKVSLAAEKGYSDPEDPYIVAAARELVQTDVKDGNR